MTDTNKVYSFAYDSANKMTTRVMPNGVSTSYEYDGLSRLTRLKHAKDTTTLFDYQYTHNTANQITQITEPTVRTRTFGYDNADRLTSSTSTLPNQNESYTFDDVGNRTSSHLSSVYGYQQGSFNRLASTQQASYSFDNNGNLTSKSEGTAKWYYSYDRENRLTNAAKFGGMMPRANESVNYQYDALGRRVVRQDKKSGRTEFTHDGMDVIQDRFEKNDGSTSTTNYINGLGIDDKLKLTNGTTSKYFLTDHLGSTVGMSDTNGNITESATYDSFGNKTGTLSTRYGYTGREADEKTGLMYYRARQYDPQIGRFTSEDPIGFAGGDINLYGYVKNNPLSSTDPSGLTEEAMIWRMQYHNDPGTREYVSKWDNCFSRCLLSIYGLTGLIGGAAVASGQPISPKPFVTPGSSPATSPASKTLSELFPQKLPWRVWAPTLKNPGARSIVIGRVLGRWVPIIGWAIIAYDVYSIMSCTNACYNGECDR